MKIRTMLAGFFVTAMCFSVVACGKTQTNNGSNTISSETTLESGSSGSSETGGQNEDLKQGDFVIGLSNSYIGNTWRKQMVDSFTNAAEDAKSKGLISGFEIQNGDSSVNSQIAQINSFILQKVDAICICAASPTALNSTIQKALDQGIKVIAFDSIVDLEGVYTMDYPWQQVGRDSVEYVSKKLNGKGNVVVVRGVSGAAPDKGIYEGISEAIKEHPDLKIVQEVIGEASATKTQEELIKVLPSLDQVDAVITHCGGDAIGVVNAFKNFPDRDMPIIIGDNTAEFITWWQSNPEYETLSQGSTPGCGAAAFWAALNVLNGNEVPENMMLDIPHITKDNLSEYKDMKPGTFVSPDFTNEYVVENIINKSN